MAQTGYTPIQLYRTATPAAAPAAVDLAAGELAINTADGKIFYKDSGGVVQVIATKDAAGGSFTTVNATNLEVTNLKAKDGTAAGSIANSTGVVTLASSVLTTTDINGGTIDGVTIGGASAGAATFTTVGATTGNITTVNATTLDSTNLEVTNIKAKDGTAALSIADSTGVVTGSTPQIISVNSASDALRITQTGAGNALLVEDSANPDATPFVVDASGNVSIGIVPAFANNKLSIAGSGDDANTWLIKYRNDSSAYDVRFYKTRSTNVYTYATVQSGDTLGGLNFYGDDGTGYRPAAGIGAFVDGTPGTNDMPGRLVFSTTADGASSPTERMRINNAGSVGIGATAITEYGLRLGKAITGATTAYAMRIDAPISSDVTTFATGYSTRLYTDAAAFTLADLTHYQAFQTTLGAGSAITNQYGFRVESSLTAATNNYGFYSNIASGTGRWNFYAAGTAANYFAGNTSFGSATTNDYKLYVSTGYSVIGAFNTTTLPVSNAAGGSAFYWNRSGGGAETNIVNLFDNATLSFEFAQKTGASTQSRLLRFGTSEFIAYTADTERMRIDSAGNVLIATTTTPSSAGLSVGSTGVVRQILGGMQNTSWRIRERTAVDWCAWTTNINDGGVQDDASQSSWMTQQGHGNGNDAWRVARAPAGSSTFSELMRVSNAGNVGIGTSNTSGGRLTVEKPAATASWAMMGKSAGVPNDSGVWIDASNNAELVARNGSGTLNVSIKASGSSYLLGGNVGIGLTSPSYRLHVVGGSNNNVIASGASDGSMSRFILANTNRTWSISNYGTEYSPNGAFVIADESAALVRMLINTSGNVGIGTSSPGASTKLNVNGRGLFTGGAYDSFDSTASGVSISYDTGNNVGIVGAVQTGVAERELRLRGNTLTFFTNGENERMRINSAGNVGIGTSSPASIIHAYGNASEIRSENTSTAQYVSGRLRLKGPASSYRSTVLVHGNNNTGGTDTFFAIEAGNTSDGYLQTLGFYNYASQFWSFFTNSTEKMRIDSSGNVGIGTSSPGYKLDVSGTGSFTGSSGVDAIRIAGAGGSWFWIDNPTGTTLRFSSGSTAGTNPMILDSSGNVGIGTASPGAKLHVSDSSDARIRIGLTDASQYTDISRDSSTGFTVYNAAQAAPFRGHVWQLGGTEAMRIASNGYVGIGTSSPVATLDVNGDISTVYNSIISSNLYYDYGTSQWKYRANGYAGAVKLCEAGGGAMQFIQAGNNTSGAGAAASIVERMRIDSSGNVGIGVSAVSLGTNIATVDIAGSAGGGLRFRTTGAGNSGYLLANTSGIDLFTGDSLYLRFGTAGTERARISSSGDFLVGRTSYVAYADAVSVLASGVISLGHPSGTGDGSGYILFGLNGSGLGAISQQGTTGVLYSSNSDYRLKENIKPMQNALATVAQLNPVTYTWKADGSDGQGFIAHELQAIVPDCVSGEKDAVDKDGKPQYQGVDTSFLVATLTKAIQEQQAIIESLTARVAQLEGK